MKTRLHSSGMHTARLLTVSCSMYCAGGCLVPGGLFPGGRVSRPGGAGSGCVPGLGVLVPERGCLVPGGCLVSQHALRQTPL